MRYSTFFPLEISSASRGRDPAQDVAVEVLEQDLHAPGVHLEVQRAAAVVHLLDRPLGGEDLVHDLRRRRRGDRVDASRRRP